MEDYTSLVSHPALPGKVNDAVLAANAAACAEHEHVRSAFAHFRARFEAQLGGDMEAIADGMQYVGACMAGEKFWGQNIKFAPPKKVSVAKSDEPDVWTVALAKRMAYHLEVAFYANFKDTLALLKAGTIKSTGFPEDLDLNQSNTALFAVWQKARGGPSTFFSVGEEYLLADEKGYESPEYPSEDPAEKGKLRSIQWGCYSNPMRNISGGKVKQKKEKETTEKVAVPPSEAPAPDAK